jgi:hypothetical protein
MKNLLACHRMVTYIWIIKNKEVVMKKILLILFVLSSLINAQEEENKCSKLNFGLELDALPYISGGYYGSVWGKIDNYRIRPVITKLTQPEFVVDDNFKELKTKVFALLVDYVFSTNESVNNSFWVGTGIEYWDNSIVEKSSAIKKSFSNFYYTLGGGYIYKFWNNFYINPWIAVHLKIGGDSELSFDVNKYKPSVFVPEGSIKIGYEF